MNDIAVAELLDRLVPLRHEDESDWDNVLARAAVLARIDSIETRVNGGTIASTPRTTVMSPKASVQRRNCRALALLPAAAVAAAVFALIAFWPGGGSSGGVLQHALGAIGADPIIHVVYRDEMHEEFVDLKSGQTTPLYEQHEEWFQAGEGLREVSTFNGREVDSFTHGPDKLPPQDQQTYAGILDGYRQALGNGTATVAGRDTIAGREVIWISFKGEQLFDVGDHRYHAWSHEVAVDATTYQPVFVRETRDGAPIPGTGQEILSLDTLSDGSVDFTPTPPPRPQAVVMGADNVEDITPRLADGAADQALGAPALWLGSSYDNLPLAFAQRADLTSGPIAAPEHAVGVQFCYGTALPPAAITPAQKPTRGCDTNNPHVLVEESTAPASWYQWDRTIEMTIPKGLLLVGWGGNDGFLIRGGVYIHILASDRDQVIAAAKALAPLR